MLHTSIGIGIGIARGQYYWILGALLGIVLTVPTLLLPLATHRKIARTINPGGLVKYQEEKKTIKTIGTNPVLLQSMTSAKFYVNSIFVIDDATDTRHRTIYQALFLIQCSLLYLVRQWAWVSKQTHVMNAKVTTA